MEQNDPETFGPKGFLIDMKTFLLYAAAALSMLLGYFFARAHGRASRANDKYAERLCEFARNASIQFSAMLFALATALALFNIQIAVKEREQILADKVVALSVIIDRASSTERALRAVRLVKLQRLMPSDCDGVIVDTDLVYGVIERSKTVNEKCATASEAKRILIRTHRREIESGINDVIETIRIRDDWIKYPFFSRNYDNDALNSFVTVEGLMYYRQALIIKLLDKIESENSRPDEVVYAISHLDKSMNYFYKSAVIYLSMYYAAFGNVENPLRDKELKEIRQYIMYNTDKLKKMAWPSFILTVAQYESDKCVFQGFPCTSLVQQFLEPADEREP